SSVTFLVDAEQRFIERCISVMNRLSLEDLVGILRMPLSMESKSIIKNSIEHKLFVNYQKETTAPVADYVLVEYIDHIPQNILDFQNGDFDTSKIVFNVMERLFEIDVHGNISNALAAHYEWAGDALHIFIRKDVRYYNGDTLYAQDAASALSV